MKTNRNPISILALLSVLAVPSVSFAQIAKESYHQGAKPAWGGTGKVCNVCHEPFQAHYTNRQPTPYQNHQVISTAFRGNKMDGSPVIIRPDKGSDKCQACHSAQTADRPRRPLSIDSCEFRP